MNALLYRLRLIEPVLVAQVQTQEENSAIGSEFIPGSVVRGALISHYLEHLKNAAPQNLAEDDEARNLFFTGDVCFLHAYPVWQDQRMLPAPLSWQREKDVEESEIYDMAFRSAEKDDEEPQLKAIDKHFCHIYSGSAVLYSPSRQLSVHIALNNANRRGAENNVFRYDALAEGEVFQGAIISKDDRALQKLFTLLELKEIHLGRAHTAGYGKAVIEPIGDPKNPIEPGWREYQPPEPNEEDEFESSATEKSKKIVVTFLSDTIVRCKNGQIDGDFDSALGELLGKSVRSSLRYRRMRVVGGFNRKWSLPLVQCWAIRAGSVFVYDANENKFDLNQLEQKAELGIGERTVEGYGRIAINWQSRETLKKGEYDKAPVEEKELSATSKQLAQRMANRRLRALLERKLAERVNTERISSPPKNSQLSAIRNVAQRALLNRNLKLKPILDHLDGLRKAASDQFKRAHIENSKELLIWIRERAEQMDVNAQLLGSSDLPKMARVTAELTEDLKVEFTARLIDGIMKKTIKENQEARQ